MNLLVQYWPYLAIMGVVLLHKFTPYLDQLVGKKPQDLRSILEAEAKKLADAEKDAAFTKGLQEAIKALQSNLPKVP